MQKPPKDKSIQWVIGIDEVGRGPIAGPVLVCGFAVRVDAVRGLKGCVQYLTDSKKLSAKKREHAYDQIIELIKNKNYYYSSASVSAKQIDTRGISWAIRSALATVLKKLEKSPAQCTGENAYVLLDGGLRAPESYRYQKTIIKGDLSEPVISAASILAKVTRDRVMRQYAKKFPEYAHYGFEKNKGYGTREHYKALSKYGASRLHRKTWIRDY